MKVSWNSTTSPRPAPPLIAGLEWNQDSNVWRTNGGTGLRLEIPSVCWFNQRAGAEFATQLETGAKREPKRLVLATLPKNFARRGVPWAS